MKQRPLTSDILAALIITIGLFIGSLGIWDGARGADFSPVEPICHDRYQITFKAVLHCDLDRQSQL